MTQVFLIKSKKRVRVEQLLDETPAALHHAYVFAYYAGDDEVVEHDPLDAAAYAAWADQVEYDD